MPVGGKKRPHAVGGKFPFHPVGGGKGRIEERCAGHGKAACKKRGGTLRGPGRLFPQKEHGGHGEHRGAGGHGGEQGNDGVGFSDVPYHLRGIDEIIHGNEVEATAEFPPEQGFGHGGEEKEAGVQPEGEEGQRAADSSAEPVLFQENERRKGQGEEKIGEKVVERALEIQNRQRSGCERGVETAVRHDEQHGSDGGIDEQPEQKQQAEVRAPGVFAENHGRLLESFCSKKVRKKLLHAKSWRSNKA